MHNLSCMEISAIFLLASYSVIFPFMLIFVDILSQTVQIYWKYCIMHIEKLKLFLHGLPPDCQGSTLKDFLEGTVLTSYGKSG